LPRTPYSGDGTPAIGDIPFEHSLHEIYSVRRKKAQIQVMLAASNGSAAGNLPAFVFDGGNAARQFLAYMQVNLAVASATSPYLQIDPADNARYLVRRPGDPAAGSTATAPPTSADVAALARQVASARVAHVSQQATRASNDLSFRIFESGSRVKSFFNNVGSTVADLASDVVGAVEGPTARRNRGKSAKRTGAEMAYPAPGRRGYESGDSEGTPATSSDGEPDHWAAPAPGEPSAAAAAKAKKSTHAVFVRNTVDLGDFGGFDMVDNVPELPKLVPCERGEPVTAATWASFFDAAGSVADEAGR
jgi:hypothetical protein